MDVDWILLAKDVSSGRLFMNMEVNIHVLKWWGV
jgi:hypothetical protein